MNQSEQALAAVTSASFEPWREVLGQLSCPAFEYEPRSPSAPAHAPVLWLVCAALDGPKANAGVPLGLVCEAFSLLNLLARVDFELWKSTIKELWPVSSMYCDWLKQNETPVEIPMLGIATRYGQDDRAVGLRHFRGSRPVSRLYESLRVSLEAAVVDEGGGSCDVMIPIRVEMDWYGLKAAVTHSMLKETLKIAESQQARASASRKTRLSQAPSYRLVEVLFRSTQFSGIDDQGLECLSKIGEHGVCVGHLPPLWISNSLSRPAKVVRSLRSLLVEEKEGNAATRIVSIAGFLSHHLVPALLSAVQHNQHIKRVEINLDGYANEEHMEEWLGQQPHRDRLRDWEQVAYALFSDHVTHNLDTLVLNVRELRLEDVEAIRRIVEAKNPLAVVHGSLDVLSTNTPARISTSTFYLEDPNCRRRLELSGDIDQEIGFQAAEPVDVGVITTSDDDGLQKYWTVWLPGHGKAWVNPEDVQAASASYDQQRDCCSRPFFPSIQLDEMMIESADAVIDLLKIVGRRTESITYRIEVYPALSDDWCRQLLHACPILERLDLGYTVLESMDCFVEGAMTGQCRLRELHGIRVANGDGILQLLRALADPAHRLTKRLVSLDIAVDVERANTDAIVAALLHMIRQNRRTYKVNVRLNAENQDDCDHAIAKYYYGPDPLNNDELSAVVYPPLEIRQKLAFLSVLSSNDDGNNNTRCQTMRSLDSHHIANIFEYAIQGRARDVGTSFSFPSVPQ